LPPAIGISAAAITAITITIGMNRRVRAISAARRTLANEVESAMRVGGTGAVGVADAFEALAWFAGLRWARHRFSTTVAGSSFVSGSSELATCPAVG